MHLRVYDLVLDPLFYYQSVKFQFYFTKHALSTFSNKTQAPFEGIPPDVVSEI